nr:hypothetical protein KitaXyl93_04230 [Kitasatospora sp. Xyl93]
MGVHGGGDADVGVAEEFLDHDDFDALLQEKRRGRVGEVVKSDLPESRSAEERFEVSGEGYGFDRVAVWPGEEVTAVLPALAGLLPLLSLLAAGGVPHGPFADALGGEGVQGWVDDAAGAEEEIVHRSEGCPAEVGVEPVHLGDDVLGGADADLGIHGGGCSAETALVGQSREHTSLASMRPSTVRYGS